MHWPLLVAFSRRRSDQNTLPLVLLMLLATLACLALCATTALAVNDGSGSANRTDRLPTMDELLELADHVASLPPRKSDVTVLIEFAIDKQPEEDLRRSVERMFASMDREDGRQRPPDVFKRDVEREVSRLLGEQEHPRRMKQRWRTDGLRYRVDDVRTRTGLEPIDGDSEWQTSFGSLSTGGDSSRDTFRLDWSQKIITIFGERHGQVIQRKDVWAGGKLGFAAALVLKSSFGMDTRPTVDESSPNDSRLLELAAGTHPEVEIWVEDLYESDPQRQFRLKVIDGPEFVFRTLADKIEPVVYLEMRGADSTTLFRSTVQDVDTNGQAVRWVEETFDAQRQRLKKVSYTLLERALERELPEDTFSITRQTGWALCDMRPETPLMVYPDGRVQNGEVQVTTPGQPQDQRRRHLPLALIANIAGIATLVYALWVLRKRRSP